MRIHGRGSSSFGFGDNRQDSQRSARFRKAHKAGQKVKGTVVEWRAPGLAWVEIDGHRLLANLAQDSALGLERYFLIVSLSPDIVLKEIAGARADSLNVVV